MLFNVNDFLFFVRVYLKHHIVLRCTHTGAIPPDQLIFSFSLRRRILKGEKIEDCVKECTRKASKVVVSEREALEILSIYIYTVYSGKKR